jgi:hypothetical protein
MTDRDFSTATYKTKPRFAKSAITGMSMAERSPLEREEGRLRVAEKLHQEDIALQAQRDRIAALHSPKKMAANDNNHDGAPSNRIAA